MWQSYGNVVPLVGKEGIQRKCFTYEFGWVI